MFASLGQIKFSTLESFEAFEAKRSHTYAEHQIVEGKNILQWIGDGLEELKIQLMLHVKFTNPATALQALRTAASAHKALPLLYGNGYFRGKFVITDISVTYQQLSDLGDLIYVTCEVSLKEWVPDIAGVLIDQPPTAPLALAAHLTTSSVGSFFPDTASAHATSTSVGSFFPPTVAAHGEPGVSPLLTNPNPSPADVANFIGVPPSTVVRAG